MKDQNFDQKLNTQLLDVWRMSFKSVVEGFLGKQRAENAELLVQDPLEAYKTKGYRMSQKFI